MSRKLDRIGETINEDREMTNGITRETWDKAEKGTQLDILFDLMLDISKKVKKLEGRRLAHGLIQFSGSLMGGAMIILAYLKWFAPIAKAGGAG